MTMSVQHHPNYCFSSSLRISMTPFAHPATATSSDELSPQVLDFAHHVTELSVLRNLGRRPLRNLVGTVRYAAPSKRCNSFVARCIRSVGAGLHESSPRMLLHGMASPCRSVEIVRDTLIYGPTQCSRALLVDLLLGPYRINAPAWLLPPREVMLYCQGAIKYVMRTGRCNCICRPAHFYRHCQMLAGIFMKIP